MWNDQQQETKKNVVRKNVVHHDLDAVTTGMQVPVLLALTNLLQQQNIFLVIEVVIVLALVLL